MDPVIPPQVTQHPGSNTRVHLMDLNPEVDLTINTADLGGEFRALPLLLYRYYTMKAQAERELDMAKASLKETKALVYKHLKMDITVKRTEAGLEAEIETHPTVQASQQLMIDSQRTATTWLGAVESLKAKKDMLVQLGADSRKDR